MGGLFLTYLENLIISRLLIPYASRLKGPDTNRGLFSLFLALRVGSFTVFKRRKLALGRTLCSSQHDLFGFCVAKVGRDKAHLLDTLTPKPQPRSSRSPRLRNHHPRLTYTLFE